jgi:ribose 5-phosphate isomerase B
MKIYLRELGYQVEDEGAFALETTDDYPDYIKVVAKMVQGDEGSRGLIFGASGQGEAMCANRFRGVRAAVYYGGNLEIVTLSREHNDANILSLGARFVSETEAQEAIKHWLSTPFSGEERHRRRITKIDDQRQAMTSF